MNIGFFMPPLIARFFNFPTNLQLLSLVVKRSKHTGQSDGFGFLRFTDNATATRILKSYNGQKMPNADQDFNLNWAAQSYAPGKLPEQDPKLDRATQQDRHTDEAAAAAASSSEHAIFVGDLAHDVTEYMLHHLFKSRYPSVKSAKVIFDKLTGHSKCYGFVSFGDANEHAQAMTEMNGAYCSTRPMRIGPAPNKKCT
jgi:RNA recognition motif-containing protein